jgi:DNA-binding MarR family transcriptional regulator
MPDPLRRRSGQDPAATRKTIKDLLSYRIHRLANALSRGAALRYRQEFDVSLMEWRIIALLGDFAPMTLKQLAKESGLDKSLASRAVASLVERGLVLREIGQQDAREVALRLSSNGKLVHLGLMRSALERDEAFAACLTQEERVVLDRAMQRLEAEAKRQSALGHHEEPLAAPGTR